MYLEKIISMANASMRLRFFAMERSLRATGCDLPLLVIPYDENLFELPAGSTWWRVPKVSDWLLSEHARPVMQKYQCLTERNYQFVDADVCFLRNPQEVLSDHSGFITSCGHWHNPNQTCTSESQALFAANSTTWQKNVFNTGQFACDRMLYEVKHLKGVATHPSNRATCLDFKFHEQPGINLLVALSGVAVDNLTLPPSRMESTWAGDYPGDYEHYWSVPDRKPYLIHWAGTPMDVPRPLNQIFYQFLTQAERQEWDEQIKQETSLQRKKKRSVRVVARRVKRAIQTFTSL